MAYLPLAGCGGSTGSDTTGANGNTAPATNAVAVDPYIVGATFFEDMDGDGQLDAGEQVSGASASDGVFTFASPLTNGSIITILDKGEHNGVTYKGVIKRKVDDAGTLVVSPLTTLLSNGWTEEQVIHVLTDAGLSNITSADLRTDPMQGIEPLDGQSIAAEDLKKIQASISIYSFLSIMDGILNGAGYSISHDTFVDTDDGIDAEGLLARMVSMIENGVSLDVMEQIDQTLSTASAQCSQYGLGQAPAATAGDVIRTSVAIADYVIPKVVANINYAPSTLETYNWRWELGRNFYIIRNVSNPCIKAGIQYGFLPDLSAYGTFIVNDSGQIEGIR